jgi:hypothetical protein
LSSQVNKVTYKNKKQALIDRISGKRISRKFDHIYTPESMEDTLGVFIRNDGKRGYISLTTGKTKIRAQYDFAWQFSEGYAAVVQNNNLSFIDLSNNKIQKQFPYKTRLHNIDRVENAFIFRNGISRVSSFDKYGLTDSDFQIILRPEFDFISDPYNNFRIIQEGSNYGLWDENARQIILEATFKKIELSDGIIISDIFQSGRIKYFISFNDMKAAPFAEIKKTIVFDDVYPIYADPDEKIPSEYSSFTIDEKTGILHTRSGKVICLARFDAIEYFSSELFKAYLDDNVFFIDKSGKIVNIEIPQNLLKK